MDMHIQEKNFVKKKGLEQESKNRANENNIALLLRNLNNGTDKMWISKGKRDTSDKREGQEARAVIL